MKWTEEQENFLRTNIHLKNKILADKLGTTLASVENKVRELGIARVFKKSEDEILREVWGKNRRAIEKALPRFNWNQIRKRAHAIGLPTLTVTREEVHIYSIINRMGRGKTLISKWEAAGLKIRSERGKNFKLTMRYVNIEKFWKFAIKNPDIVDIARLPLDLLGEPPPKYAEIVRNAKPFDKKPIIKGDKREKIADMFYLTNKTAKECADIFNTSDGNVRRIAAEFNKRPRNRKSKKDVVTDEFLKRVEKLYFVEGLTCKKCADELECSVSSVRRGLVKIRDKNRIKSKGI